MNESNRQSCCHHAGIGCMQPLPQRGGMVYEWGQKSFGEAAAFIAPLADADRERLHWMLPDSDHTTAQLTTVAATIQSSEERRHFLAESFAKVRSENYDITDPLIQLGLKQDAAAMTIDPNARNAIGAAAANLEGRNPAEAWQWAQTLPECPLQESSVSSIAAAWMNKSPEDASAWARDLPGGPLRDAAAESIVQHILTDDRERAAGWAAAIQDPQDGWSPRPIRPNPCRQQNAPRLRSDPSAPGRPADLTPTHRNDPLEVRLSPFPRRV